MYQGTIPAVTNRADWLQTVQVFVAETGEPFDMTGADIVVQLRKCQPNWGPWDYGFWDDGGWSISATTLNGRADASMGELTFHFSRADMTGLCPGTYQVGITATRDDFTSQIILGTVPVLGGGVPK